MPKKARAPEASVLGASYSALSGQLGAWGWIYLLLLFTVPACLGLGSPGSRVWVPGRSWERY